MERRSAEFQDMVKELRARVESAESREVVAALRARVDDLKERNRELKAEALGLREKQQALRANGQVTTTSRSWKRLVPGWLARLRRRFG
jgi:FtsZ-binding cell division protein ZapB